MGFSKLIDKKILAHKNNYAKGRDGYKVSKLTIHHIAGNLTIEQCGKVFKSAGRYASSNYGIGSDGRIGGYVDEKNRPYTSSSYSNDVKAVTVEVANNGSKPNWPISDKALKSTIKLLTDVCKRNKIKKVNYNKKTSGNLTRHNMFAATACPGPYLQSKLPYIADKINEALSQKIVIKKWKKKKRLGLKKGVKSLNARTFPDASTSKNIYTKLTPKSKRSYFGYVKINGYTWYCYYNIKGKIVYVASKFLNKKSLDVKKWDKKKQLGLKKGVKKLNVRTSPSTGEKNIITTLNPKSFKRGYFGEVTANGIKWYCYYNAKGKVRYVSAKYLEDK